MLAEMVAAPRAEPRAGWASQPRFDIVLEAGAAQGGFAWGVIDRVLEDGRVGVRSVRATNAGVVNALGLAAGVAAGGRAVARRLLAVLWRDIARAVVIARPPAFWFAPDEFGPAHHALLRRVFERRIDFAAVRAAPVEARLCMASGAFAPPSDRVSLDLALASACLPWAVSPAPAGSERQGGHEILAVRATSNSGAVLARETAALGRATDAPGGCGGGRPARVQAIEVDEAVIDTPPALGLIWEHLLEQRDLGRAAASAWLAREAAQLA